MSCLAIFNEDTPTSAAELLRDGDLIAKALDSYGVSFERVSALIELKETATAEEVLQTYAPFIEREKKARGYQTADVVRIVRGQQNTAPMRAKFLSEHIHSEDEARLFAEGSGAFYLHLHGSVLMMVCTAGDYIRVPAGTKHWFDMGAAPCFTAVRIFTDPAGWVANFTGESIAEKFPRYEGEWLL